MTTANRTTVPAPVENPPAPAAPTTATRALCVGAVVATLPYAAIKVAWLTGSRAGLNDPEFGASTVMNVANGLTLALDVAAAGLAAIFATRRGVRAPGWLTVFPMWVGYGLLGYILLIVPLTLLGGTIGSQPSDGGGPIDGWVYAFVYLGFSGLGLCLLPAFALYARRRWHDLLARPVSDGAPHRATVAAGVAAAACGVAAGGAAVALRGEALVGLGADAALAGVAAWGLAVLGHARAEVRTWVPLLAAYTGTGALFAWGLFHTVLEVVPNDLVSEQPPVIAVVYSVARLVAGVGGGIALASWWRRTAQ